MISILRLVNTFITSYNNNLFCGENFHIYNSNFQIYNTVLLIKVLEWDKKQFLSNINLRNHCMSILFRDNELTTKRSRGVKMVTMESMINDTSSED